MSLLSFESSLQQLFAELERVDLFLRTRVWRLRQVKRDDKFEGLYISDAEIDEQLRRPLGAPRWTCVDRPLAAALEEQYSRLRSELEARTSVTLAAGVRLRLEELVAHFELTAFDRDVILLGLAPEVDPRYERVFAYLQDDVSRRRPSVNLILELVCPTLEDKLSARAHFEANAPLLRHGLIELIDEPSQPQPTLLGRCLRLDPRIASFLLGSDEVAAELGKFVTHIAGCARDERVGPPAVEQMLDRIAACHCGGEGLVVNVVGPTGVGKKAWSRALCAELELGLLIVRVQDLLTAGAPGETLRRLHLVRREAVLQRAAIYWDGVDVLVEEEHRALIESMLAPGTGPLELILLGSARPWVAAEHLSQLRLARVELPPLTYAERVELWRRELPADRDLEAEIPALATKFRFNGGQIQAAASNAMRRVRLRLDGPALTVAELYAACRTQSRRQLAELARVIRPHYTWKDIVLPPECMRQLRELCDRVRLRGVVHEGWGFDKKLSIGKGLNVLFSGPSGTGKTMAAEILAGELNLELYKIDLAGIVSKYIGETEKNLSRIFAEAESSNAILFFDEADALFGKRSEVKDSHDRYANIETSYLLQRMEEYDGLTILSTNLRKNIDEAFIRRMTFALTFALPEEAERLDLWHRVWPAETPLDPAIDVEFLARQFKLSGGNIKNIALAAAFLAASQERAVSMEHLILGVKRELQKVGRHCGPGDFGKYARLAE